MIWCENCQCLEGDTKTIEIEDQEVTVCAYCEEELTRVPEHDDYDLER
jgi:ribosome-binding protein aMBF1 (putative translation factor)